MILRFGYLKLPIAKQLIIFCGVFGKWLVHNATYISHTYWGIIVVLFLTNIRTPPNYRWCKNVTNVNVISNYDYCKNPDRPFVTHPVILL